MANPTTNYSFVLPTSTDLVTDLPADFDVALQGVDTRLKALQPGTTAGDLAYSSATANTNVRLGIGTAGQVLAVSGGVPAWTTTADVTPLTTKGDLFTFSTVDARLAVGATNGMVLTVDSTTPTGLKYATPAASSTFTTDILVNTDVKVGKGNSSVSSNTVLGTLAGNVITTGGNNSFFGFEAGKLVTTGFSNLACGDNALPALVTGNQNVAVGTGALFACTGNNNTAVGSDFPGGSITTGAQNTSIGTSTAPSLTTGSNNTMLGYQAAPSSASTSNTITLGNSSITTLRCQVTSITSLSDKRDKSDITPLEYGLDFVQQLQPVQFKWNTRPEIRKDVKGSEIVVQGKVDIADIGFIAQDIVALEDELNAADSLQLSYRENPEKLEVTQGRLIPILVKAIQDLAAKIAILENK